MKSVSQMIFEASGKPSDLKKYKKTERKETVHFISGDIYDFSDPGYDDEFSYYDGSGNGYIKDKQGHVYDVIAHDSTSDAGRIAGGCQNFSVTIKKANLLVYPGLLHIKLEKYKIFGFSILTNLVKNSFAADKSSS